jgi:hypothetical protein
MRFLHFAQKLSRPVKQKARRPRARLVLETLEARTTPSVSLSNGHLLVKDYDFTTIYVFNSKVVVEVPLDIFDFPVGNVSSIEVNPGAGAGLTGRKEVDLQSTPAGVPVTVNCTGIDYVDLDSRKFDNFDLDLGGPVVVNGNGHTVVCVNDDNYSFRNFATYTITTNSVSRDGFAGLSYSNLVELELDTCSSRFNVNSTASGMSYFLRGADTAPSEIDLGDGNLDTINGMVHTNRRDRFFLRDEANPVSASYSVTSFSILRNGRQLVFSEQPIMQTDIRAGAGDDTFNVTPTILTFLSVYGGGGHNALNVNDQDADFANYFITASSITGTLGSIYYNAVEAVTVKGGNNGSFFSVESLPNGNSVILNTGAGHNDVHVGNSSHGLGDTQGYLGVFGTPPGFTTLTLDDQANTSAQFFLLLNSGMTVGHARVDFFGIGSLVLNGGSGGNLFVFRDTPLGLVTTVNAGPHADAVQAGGAFLGDLSALQGPLVINGRGNTTVNVLDYLSSTPQTYTLTGSSTGEVIARSGGLSATCTNLQSLTVTGGQGGNQFVVTAAPPTPVTLNGGTGSNTLTGPNGGSRATTWTITGAGSGKIGRTVSFSAMHDLVGPAGKDVFVLPAGGSIAGTITGSGGGDELEYAPQAGPVTVNLQTHAAPQVHGDAPGGFSGIGVFLGSASGADTLIGPDLDTSWALSGTNAGSGTTSVGRFSFSGFENLVGGSGVDVFKFAGAGRVTGSIDGGSAPLHKGDWLDYSGLTTAVTVNLQTGSATAVAGGAAGKVANIQNVHGGDGGNALTGNAQGNILIGGAGADTIIGGTGASLLIGGKGADTVRGHSRNDILIGGATAFNPMRTANEAALMGILAEWQSADSYTDRFNDINQGSSYAPGSHLNGKFLLKTGVGATVLDDAGAPDTVTEAGAGPRQDWFFQYAGDTINNQPGEHVNNT